MGFPRSRSLTEEKAEKGFDTRKTMTLGVRMHSVNLTFHRVLNCFAHCVNVGKYLNLKRISLYKKNISITLFIILDELASECIMLFTTNPLGGMHLITPSVFFFNFLLFSLFFIICMFAYNCG